MKRSETKTKRNRRERKKVGQESPNSLYQISELIEEGSTLSWGMTYACLQIAKQDSSIAEQIIEKLELLIEPIKEGREDPADSYDFECDVAPLQKWIAFLSGFMAGKRGSLPANSLR